MQTTSGYDHRRAVLGTCPRCHAPVLRGPDNRAAAIAATVDIHALTRRGELLAVIDSRKTYEIHQGRLFYRDTWRLRRQASGHVLIQHTCQPIPDTWIAPIPTAVIASTTEQPTW